MEEGADEPSLKPAPLVEAVRWLLLVERTAALARNQRAAAAGAAADDGATAAAAREAKAGMRDAVARIAARMGCTAVPRRSMADGTGAAAEKKESESKARGGSANKLSVRWQYRQLGAPPLLQPHPLRHRRQGD